MAVSINRELHHHTVPRVHIDVASGDVLHLAHVDIFLRNRLKIRHPVPDKVGKSKNDIIGCLPRLEWYHCFRIQIPCRGVDHIHFCACQLCKLFSVQCCGLPHHRNSMGIYSKLTTRIVFLGHRFIRTFPCNIAGVLDMRKLITPLIGTCW